MSGETTDLIHPVILCGGSGTRLWPASRESFPKQFIPLAEAHRSSFQATAARVTDTGLFARPAILTANDARFIVAEQLAQARLSADIILEPSRQDSAAAVTVAALHAAAQKPDALVLILAADHLVGDDAAFLTALRNCRPGAKAGHIMTLGLVPTSPATAYGYIQPGEALPGEAGQAGARVVQRFLEKPDAARAAGLISEGALWNSGYFMFRADVMLDEMRTHAPQVLEAAQAAYEAAARDLDFLRLDAEAFARAPKTSVDYAVMERTSRAAVLPVSFPWSDIGTWGALWEVSPQDADGNATRGRVALHGTRNSLVHSEGELLTTVVGLDDVVVVATSDAVLVTSRERGGEVKTLVEGLRAKGEPEADAPTADVPPLGQLPAHRHRRPLPGEAHHGEARRAALPAEALSPGGALGGGARHGRGDGGRRGEPRPRERGDLPADRLRAPPDEPRQDPAGAHRGAGRLLHGRGRHHPHRGRLRALKPARPERLPHPAPAALA